MPTSPKYTTITISKELYSKLASLRHSRQPIGGVIEELISKLDDSLSTIESLKDALAILRANYAELQAKIKEEKK
jgi:predicted CopG family antitoxin